MKKRNNEPQQPHVYDDPALPPLSAKILELLDNEKRQTLKNLHGQFALRLWRPRMIKDHLHRLVCAGLVRKHGKGKATWYTL